MRISTSTAVALPNASLARLTPVRAAVSVALVLAFSMSGCTPSSAPERSEVPVTVGPVICVNPSVTVTPLGEPTLEFSYARLREQSPGLVSERVVWDTPITSELVWDMDAPWLEQDDVRQLLSQEAPLGQSASDGVQNVNNFLQAVADDGTILGYAGQEVQRSSVRVTCADGREAEGTLTNWPIVETGVVTCGDPNSPIPPEGSVGASAQARFCP